MPLQFTATVNELLFNSGPAKQTFLKPLLELPTISASAHLRSLLLRKTLRSTKATSAGRC